MEGKEQRYSAISHNIMLTDLLITVCWFVEPISWSKDCVWSVNKKKRRERERERERECVCVCVCVNKKRFCRMRVLHYTPATGCAWKCKSININISVEWEWVSDIGPRSILQRGALNMMSLGSNDMCQCVFSVFNMSGSAMFQWRLPDSVRNDTLKKERVAVHVQYIIIDAS